VFYLKKIIYIYISVFNSLHDMFLNKFYKELQKKKKKLF